MDRTIGEQYVPMIASFHYPDHEPVPGDEWDTGWTSCNDAHEIFIAMGEVALTSAYVIERSNGELVSWNCRVTRDNAGVVGIQPLEDIVSRIHLNLRKDCAVSATIVGGSVNVRGAGMRWIGQGGIPELFC